MLLGVKLVPGEGRGDLDGGWGEEMQEESRWMERGELERGEVFENKYIPHYLIRIK